MISRAKKTSSNVPHKVAHTAFESLGDFRQGFDRGLLVPSFNIAYVISREIGLFRQFFLAQVSLFSLNANGFSQGSVDSARSRLHHFKSKQNLKTELPTTGWYFAPLSACNSQALNSERMTANNYVQRENHGT
jgi:hypothetical protein